MIHCRKNSVLPSSKCRSWKKEQLQILMKIKWLDIIGLRNPTLAPTEKIQNQINNTLQKIQQFAADIHQKKIKPQKSVQFRNVLSLGMGGSALGPQLIQSALGSQDEHMRFYFIDNTDPDGIDRVISSIGKGLAETLILIISKSGGTLGNT